MSDNENSMNLRMDAYYYGFDRTGVIEVDLILSAVATAGKAFHGTYQWNHEAGIWPPHEGETPVLWIQNAAAKAASEFNALRAQLSEAQAMLSEAADWWQSYSCMNEPAQDDIRDEKDAMLSRMRALLPTAPVSPAAQVAQGVADDVVRDYPDGWVFHSADFSMAASCPARSGRVTLVRDLAGRDWWLSLSDEDKELVPLYVYGSGSTLSDAIKDAALLAAQQQKAGGA